MAGSGTAHLRPDALLSARELEVRFPAGGGRTVHAVSGISLDALEGETLGIVGESGCGKSTTGRAILQLPRPTSGSVRFDGTELTELTGDELRRTRPALQMIFQDPISSLNPRRTVGEIVAEPLRAWARGDGAQRDALVRDTLETVGLDPAAVLGRRPHELSGGQCQRVSIARALVLRPRVLVCDEPVSALDVSVQAQILNLLEDMKESFGLTLLFIAHDLAVVKHVSDRVAVLYLGKVCEVGDPDLLYAHPRHHYTATLLEAVPVPDPTALRRPVADDGELPSPTDPPSGCRFRTRCPAADETCATEEPILRPLEPDHFVACHHPRPVESAPPG